MAINNLPTFTYTFTPNNHIYYHYNSPNSIYITNILNNNIPL